LGYLAVLLAEIGYKIHPGGSGSMI
jgi:hypothetical protein